MLAYIEPLKLGLYIVEHRLGVFPSNTSGAGRTTLRVGELLDPEGRGFGGFIKQACYHQQSPSPRGEGRKNRKRGGRHYTNYPFGAKLPVSVKPLHRA
ncbi:hypothetical protein B9Q09_00255 [Candidatus Marsarchaeota G2 archaeon ECH_B_SAG-C16]|nr:MAG: hypothetical protein B9Q08_04140 [Candidatus Marsarchaeota G2 archaeon ECH_B_SAG-M15]PSN94465.1 MAG: hypothetical protein B9Q06_09165 [Candidatus Marsarchaeota G2 archaeon ECH_B_2]PSN97857.1 MAG: hypothetical protein B9Q09_00255 [Candidatus Marsarchaeota G2 archaeon ECH_B_SAG-C16]PSN98883.1 MAG: hypothetical protein B9Q07_08280 [Candidatus Marsarchaeota G2 archaeon ECH_B_3]PSO01017.1 MAG: hypothetical protein B9Q05_09720 [Candidatus Marsarchaeota G2 archaeon ECH_B_1]PSO07017.1 MAG: hyp